MQRLILVLTVGFVGLVAGAVWADQRIDTGQDRPCAILDGDEGPEQHGQRKEGAEGARDGDREGEGERHARRDVDREGEGERRDGDREERRLRTEIRELSQTVKRLADRLERMEIALKALRRDNARLQREVAQLRAASGQAPAKAPETLLPEALQGFRGILIGEVTKKDAQRFRLKVVLVVKSWKQSEAVAPKAAVGQEVTVIVPPNTPLTARLLQTLNGLKAGDSVLVEAAHLEGRALTAMETLIKAK